MKPKDLKFPYTWEERYPLVKEGVFYLPNYYQAHKPHLFPPLHTLFGNDHPIHIEYCSGNGEWVIHQAQAHPQINWIAVEYNFDRVRKIVSKKRNQKINNLFITAGEGLCFTREYLPPNCAGAVYINFPDPWPKKRHAKHRLIQRPYIDALKKSLRPKGTFTLVTDSLSYLEQTEEVMGSVDSWKALPYPHETTHGHSYFGRLWRSLGRTIYFLHYENAKEIL